MKKVFVRTFWLLIGMIIIFPIIFNTEALAGGGSSNDGNTTYSSTWIMTTGNVDKTTDGGRTLVIETYIKNNAGVFEKSSYINDITIKFNQNNVTANLQADEGYILNHLEVWNNTNRVGTSAATSTPNKIDMTLANNQTRILKIFIEQKYDDTDYIADGNVSGGEITFDKTIAPADDIPNEFNLEFSVSGEAITQGVNADIVLVLDKSGSMEENISGNTSKADVLETAADRFIDSVLSAEHSGSNRVAVVTYSSEAQILQPFTNNAATAKNSFDNFEKRVSGGTNSEAGFISARRVFGSDFRTGAERYVIYMTDGEPTQYYNANGSVVGNGSSYDANAKNAAVLAANLLKDFGGKGVKIYTVGFASKNTSNMQALLNPSTNSYQVAYYHATTANALTDIYDIIADTIISTIAKNATVTDTLPEGFEFAEESLPDGVTISEEGVLSWNVGSISTTEASKSVKIKYIGENYGIKYANEGAEITYNHVFTPNTLDTEVFDNPLSVITPNISQYVYYDNDVEDIVITAPDIESINDAGNDYTVSDLKIRIVNQPTNGKAIVNSDNTKITYVPNAQGGADKFSYVVYFTISSANDPKNIIDGTSQTFEKLVNVTINPRPDVNLTIRYYEPVDGIYRPLIINGVSSLVKNLPANGYVDEFAPFKTGYRLINTAHSGINNPVIAGRRITGQVGKNNASIIFYYERDASLVFDNELKAYSMYANNDLRAIGNNHAPYKLVSGISYRFGLDFRAGNNVEDMNIVFAGDTNKFIVSNFYLYDENGNHLAGPADELSTLYSYINANNDYTVTYTVKPTESSKSITSTVNNVLTEDNSIPTELTIQSIDTLELE